MSPAAPLMVAEVCNQLNVRGEMNKDRTAYNGLLRSNWKKEVDLWTGKGTAAMPTKSYPNG